MSDRLDVVGIGNALVDVLARIEDDFLTQNGVEKGIMTLIDTARAAELYGRMGPATEISGGSGANTIAGLAMLGSKANPAMVLARSRTTSSARSSPTTCVPRARSTRRRWRPAATATRPAAAWCWSRPTASAR